MGKKILGIPLSYLVIGGGIFALMVLMAHQRKQKFLGFAAAPAAGGPDQIDTDCPDDPKTGLDCSEEDHATYLRNTGRSCDTCGAG